MDIVYMLLAAAAGALIYAIVVHKKPGIQPGEELIDRFIAAVNANHDKVVDAMHTNSVTQTTALAQVIPAALARQQAAAAPPPAAPTPAPAPAVAPPPAPVETVATSANVATAAPGAGSPAKVAPEWPKKVTIGGATMLIDEPINPLWSPSTAAVTIGGMEPSNGGQAVPPMPKRSPMGFPLRYTLVDGHVVGTATIPYGDTEAFNSDAELLDYRRRLNERNANLAQWQANEDAKSVLQPGQVDVTTLGVDDLCFLFKHWSELFDKVGPRPAANLAINWVAGQSSTKPFPNLPDVAPDVYRWDDSTYNGPLRALV